MKEAQTWEPPVELTDGLGRKWELRITVADLEPLGRMGLDLSDLSKAIDSCTALVRDPRQLVAVIYLLSEKQIAAANLSPEEFARGFAGNVLIAAAFKLADAVIGFFPFVEPQARAELRKELKAARSATSSKSAGKRRASSASTRGRSRSAS